MESIIKGIIPSYDLRSDGRLNNLFPILKSFFLPMEKWLQELFEDAMHSKAEVLIEVQNGVGDYIITRFQPYIIGTDSFKFEFVWGYLPLTRSYYKFLLSSVTRVILSENAYEANFDAIYQYAIGEEHTHVLKGFEMIYTRSTLMDISPN